MITTATSPATPLSLVRMTELYEEVKQECREKYHTAYAWLLEQSDQLSSIKTTSQHLLLATTVAGTMMFPRPVDTQVAEQLQVMEEETNNHWLSTITLEEHQAIVEKMKALVKQPPGHLEKQDELYLEQQLSDMLGFQITAELDGKRLNHSIGIMGSEQHLNRFPTDTLDQHDAYQEAGIAPNRGAYGWFTELGQLTPEAVQREKYYFAVQTMYLPNWNTEHGKLKEWYKFRKMVVINPEEEIAIVGVIGDAGPAQWVQKQFGGSPEIIRDGKIWSKNARGRVMLFFVDDPENKVPLGPMSIATAKTLAQGENVGK